MHDTALYCTKPSLHYCGKVHSSAWSIKRSKSESEDYLDKNIFISNCKSLRTVYSWQHLWLLSTSRTTQSTVVTGGRQTLCVIIHLQSIVSQHVALIDNYYFPAVHLCKNCSYISSIVLPNRAELCHPGCVSALFFPLSNTYTKPTDLCHSSSL